MSGFALNKENDLYFTNGKLAFINGTNTDQEILQRIRVRLRFFQGEWYLNINHGIPYLNNILGTKQININIIDNFFRDGTVKLTTNREEQRIIEGFIFKANAFFKLF